MRTFTDRKNRSWDVDVNGDSIGRVKTMTGLLLTDLISSGAANELAEDPIRILDVLWALCKPQAEERKEPELDFRKQIGGDALDAAVDALIAEVIDFFPKSRRAMAQKMVDKGREVQELATRRATETLERTTAADLLAKLTGKPPGDDSGSSQEPSGSSPAD